MTNSRLTILLSSVILLLNVSDVSFGQRVEAYIGRPFGIAKVIVPLGQETLEVKTNGYTLESSTGRALYPVFSTRRILTAIRELLGEEGQPATMAVYFLFQGDRPFDVTIRCPETHQLRVAPVSTRPRHYQRLMRQWWRQYTTIVSGQVRQSDYPPIVETYLSQMLGSRLGMDLGKLETSGHGNIEQDLLGLAFNTEALRVHTLRNRMAGLTLFGNRTLELPDELNWEPQIVGDPLDERPFIEPIAHRVPAECFYVRFGSFENYLWLKSFLESNGGDLAQMITLRGHVSPLSSKVTEQLGLQESALTRIMGPRVISDIAIIGRDVYLSDGAAIGVLFEAKNEILKTDLTKQRSSAATKMEKQGATLRDIALGDKTVSVAMTPNNRLRSIYVVDGNYHLVTNCLAIAKRFIETKNGVSTLADSPDFIQIRKEFALDRKDTVFVHMSKAFFRGLLSWNYQIELRRRMDAVVHAQIQQLAELAAQAEGIRDRSIPVLSKLGLVPAGFSPTMTVDANGNYHDPIRGERGYFLPIPDAEIGRISRAELEKINAIAKWQAEKWHDMDPLSLTFKRFEFDEEIERIRVSARMVPFERQKYGRITSVLGPPTQQRIQFAPDDIISAQMSLQGGGMLTSNTPHTIFFGMKDVNVPVEFGGGTFFRVLKVLKTAPAYLGAWPKPGLLDMLPLVRRRSPDASGLTSLPLGLWRWESENGFSVVSFHRDLLLDSVPHLGVGLADDPAQIRLRIGNVVQSRIKGWFNSLNYHRAFETSAGNTKLFHQLTQQLRVPAPDARQLAESLLSVRLVCPLGGDYSFDQRTQTWRSNAWNERHRFDSKFAGWFRGIEAKLILKQDRVIADALLDVKRIDKELKLPKFDLFGHSLFDRPSRPKPQARKKQTDQN